jgi:hypothetical protein
MDECGLWDLFRSGRQACFPTRPSHPDDVIIVQPQLQWAGGSVLDIEGKEIDIPDPNSTRYLGRLVDEVRLRDCARSTTIDSYCDTLAAAIHTHRGSSRSPSSELVEAW